MKAWETVARARTPDGGELSLVRHPSEWAILLGRDRLMTSRMHGSEDALATLGCADAARLPAPRVLIGGLGMGYTLRAALDVLPPTAEVIVAELVADVVDWNRGPIADLAGRPLDDPRVQVELADVGVVMRQRRDAFDAVLLDVDNGPEALVTAGNAWLYSDAGIAASRACLRPGGIIAHWAIHDDPRFERRLRAAGFLVERRRVRARAAKRFVRHTVLLARRPA